jgi:hypothetical protein
MNRKMMMILMYDYNISNILNVEPREDANSSGSICDHNRQPKIAKTLTTKWQQVWCPSMIGSSNGGRWTSRFRHYPISNTTTWFKLEMINWPKPRINSKNNQNSMKSNNKNKCSTAIINKYTHLMMRKNYKLNI